MDIKEKLGKIDDLSFQACLDADRQSVSRIISDHEDLINRVYDLMIRQPESRLDIASRRNDLRDVAYIETSIGLSPDFVKAIRDLGIDYHAEYFKCELYEYYNGHKYKPIATLRDYIPEYYSLNEFGYIRLPKG